MEFEERSWLVSQIGYRPEKQAFYESIFSLANGYMGMRGFDEEKVDKKGYENCTFIAGIFDYFKNGITDMVNVPNFNYTRIYANDVTFSVEDSTVLDYEKTLNMKSGTLKRSFIWEDQKGNRTKIESLKFLSIYDKHIACTQYKITPINYVGSIKLEMGIDGRVSSNPINDDQVKNDINPVIFLKDINIGTEGKTGYLSAITKGTGDEIYLAFQMENSIPEGEANEEFVLEDRVIVKAVEFNAKMQVDYEFIKFTSVYTSRDDINNPFFESIKDASDSALKGYKFLYDKNCELWMKRWDVSDVKIEGDDISQQGIRFNIFNLLQSCDEDNPNISIGARGLTHSRYKGCYFWDTDIFMFPFYLYTNPKAARSLIMFRYNTLSSARKNAERQNLKGARFPWMCNRDGIEQCDTWDIGLSEVHITADIAYTVGLYVSVTGDEEFMADHGAEVLIETARYWGSRFTYDSRSKEYNLLFVKGPNEYGGVSNNNTYTIFMAVNNFKLARKAVQFLKNKYPQKYNALKEKLSFDEDELIIWDTISKKVHINYDEENKLYIEDDNFLKLEPCDIGSLKDGDRASYNKVCFDYLQRLQVLKQADVLLLMLLLAELFTAEEKKSAWELYEPITLHDSSLSFGTHAHFAAVLKLIDKAYGYFIKSTRYNLDDIMQNTGKEGLHMASMGSSYQAVVFGFGGLFIENKCIKVNPALPSSWKSLEFSIYFRDELYRISISAEGPASVKKVFQD